MALFEKWVKSSEIYRKMYISFTALLYGLIKCIVLWTTNYTFSDKTRFSFSIFQIMPSVFRFWRHFRSWQLCVVGCQVRYGGAIFLFYIIFLSIVSIAGRCYSVYLGILYKYYTYIHIYSTRRCARSLHATYTRIGLRINDMKRLLFNVHMPFQLHAYSEAYNCSRAQILVQRT